ncbi:hypothetical protein [Candidatus Uabimicrobium amorphum]|uniref:PEGA domain-containing protein n=1 Tax=Uabimicrobium amorphum TaxID=2596890 RepID=A0A5S9IJQ2_UABAM|nr:hypothetical protein [Candidatus Uabimicrobium amorphum]BBM83118.1 hypothetical protein UABAM_01469 [Candidatus Uabimicrobium amorphum]
MFKRCFLSVFIIAAMLIADQDQVQIELQITYNSPAEYGTPNCKVSLKNQTQTVQVKDGDMVNAGKYIISLESKGYQNHSDEISITKDNHKFVFAYQFIAVKRKISNKIISSVTGKVITPDTITVNDKPLTKDLELLPGQYDFAITKKGYMPMRKIITILASDKEFVLEQKLKAYGPSTEKPKDLSHAHVVLKLVSDFNRKPITPDSSTLDGKPFVKKKENAEIRTKNTNPTLEIKKRGYYSIIEYLRVHRGEKNVIVRNLVSKPRKFQVNIVSSSGKSLTPQQLKLGKQDIRYAQHIKPGKYEFYASIEGYQPIKKNIEVIPDEKPYVIHEVMQAVETTKKK